MPIISHMGIQCCPVPTSIFSNHTGFPEFFFDDYTDKMQEYIDNWKKLDLHFSGIMTGFLGSKKQIDIVKKFIHDFKDPETKVLIDPAMGENGKAYPTYTEEMCLEMKKLIEEHEAATGSPLARRILDHFDEYLPKFKKIIPHDYAKMLNSIKKFTAEGMNPDDARISAFYENTK